MTRQCIILTLSLLTVVALQAEDTGDAVQGIALDEIVVTSTFSILKDEPISGTALSREEILDLPHFADDLFRAVMVLPGTAAGDISGRFAVRGG